MVIVNSEGDWPLFGGSPIPEINKSQLPAPYVKTYRYERARFNTLTALLGSGGKESLQAAQTTVNTLTNSLYHCLWENTRALSEKEGSWESDLEWRYMDSWEEAGLLSDSESET